MDPTNSRDQSNEPPVSGKRTDRELIEAARRQTANLRQSDGVTDCPSTELSAGLKRQAIGNVLPGQFAVGKRLGDYELLDCVGRGGMGAVFRAKHTRLQRIVALKILPQLQFADATTQKRFRREIEMIGQLPRSDHVVQASDAREIDGVHFLVMEYVEGPHLAQLVKCLGELPIADACEITRQVAKGLDHLQAYGLVHRDIKPANVIASRTGLIKILDLGLARLQTDSLGDQDLTMAGQPVGTPDYIAPEQWEDSRTADIRTDIYSLGCTLYFLLTGRPPFHASKSLQAKRLAHLEERPKLISDLRSDVPAELAEMVAKMLSKEPRQRIQCPQAVAEQLLPLAQGADVAGAVRKVETRLSDEDVPESEDDTERAAELAPETTAVYSGIDVATAPLGKKSTTRKRRWLTLAASVFAAVLLTGLMVWMFPIKSGDPLSREANSPNNMSDSKFDARPEALPVQERALQILRAGATVMAETDAGRIDLQSTSELPKDRFDIVGIDVGQTRLSENDLIPLLPESGLRFLHIPGCRLTTNGLNRIVEIAPEIEGLHLGAIDLRQVDLTKLQELKQLNTLWIGRTGIGDQAANAISKLESLGYLWMGETDITDQGISRLSKLTNLQGLGLEYTKVTKDCLPELAKMELYTLVLSGLPISDDDVHLLAELKSLQELNLTETNVTRNGRSTLRQLLPECQIH